MDKELTSIILNQLKSGSNLLFAYQNYSFQILNLSHFAEAFDLLITEFSQQNPLISSFNQKFPEEREKTQAAFRKSWGKSTKEAIKHQLAIGCFDKSNNNELVGVMISKDASIPEDYYTRILIENNCAIFYERIYEKLVRLADQQFQALLVEKHQVMRGIGAIKKKNDGKSIGSRLSVAIQFLAWRQGFKYALIFAANFKSAAIAKRLYFEKISEFNVKKFEIDNILYFQKVNESNELLSLWIKKMSYDILQFPKL